MVLLLTQFKKRSPLLWNHKTSLWFKFSLFIPPPLQHLRQTWVKLIREIMSSREYPPSLPPLFHTQSYAFPFEFCWVIEYLEASFWRSNNIVLIKWNTPGNTNIALPNKWWRCHVKKICIDFCHTTAMLNPFITGRYLWDFLR